jgi:hypothetical protein
MYEWSIPYYSSNKTLSVSHYLLVPFLSTYGLRVISNWNRRRSPYLGKIVQRDLNAAKINAVYTGNFEYTCYTKIAWNQANMWGKKISEEPLEEIKIIDIVGNYRIYRSLIVTQTLVKSQHMTHFNDSIILHSDEIVPVCCLQVFTTSK